MPDWIKETVWLHLISISNWCLLICALRWRSRHHVSWVKLQKVKISETFSFLDHLRCGLELNFVVSIDFTGSNGNPASMDSLHYMDPHRPNQYSSAIINVGNVVQDYDTDKMFPVFGFGAKIPPNGQVSHMFPCNFQNQNPFVQESGQNGQYYV